MGLGVSTKERNEQRAANRGISCCCTKMGGDLESNMKKTSDFSPRTTDSNDVGVEHLSLTSEGEGVDDQETKPHCIEREFESLVTLGLGKSFAYHGKNSPRSHSTISHSSSDDSYHSYVPTPLTQVLPRLYLGTQEDAEQEEKMTNLGITHIISIVGGGRYSHYCENHMYIPLRDNGSSDLLAELERSYDFMVESQKPDNTLFIHCQLGQNRSASFVIGFLMRYQQCCLFEAYKFLKEKRELIHPHHKYIRQLRELDIQLNKVYSTPEDFLQVSICPQNGINVQHENYSKIMSIEFKRRQSEEIATEDCHGPKESKSYLFLENDLQSPTFDTADSNNNKNSAQRSFTISRTNISRDDNAIDDNSYHPLSALSDVNPEVNCS